MTLILTNEQWLTMAELKWNRFCCVLVRLINCKKITSKFIRASLPPAAILLAERDSLLPVLDLTGVPPLARSEGLHFLSYLGHLVSCAIDHAAVVPGTS